MPAKFLMILLATVALPVAVHAQDTAPAQDQTPAMTQSDGATAAGEPADVQAQTTDPAAEGLPAATAEDARGGVPDVDISQDTTTTTGGAAPAPSSDVAMQSEGPFVTVPETGAWRVSDLDGTTVYGSEGENIGEINDVLVDQQGRVTAVIIGVGGFLGIGEKDVAVSMSALQFGPGDVAAAADPGYATPAETMAPDGTVAPGTADGTGVTGSTATDPLASGGATLNTGNDQVGTTVDPNRPDMVAGDPDAVRIDEDGMPDRIVLNVTKEQLEDAPKFEGVRAAVRQQ